MTNKPTPSDAELKTIINEAMDMAQGKSKPTPAEFQALCTQLGDDVFMANLLQVNQSTVYRWRLGLRPVPYSVCELLRYKIKELNEIKEIRNLMAQEMHKMLPVS